MAATLPDILAATPVIPVLTIADVANAVGVAQALVEGGLPVIEVTLRTPAALDAIREMRRVPGALVGAGTVLDPEQLQAAADAGAAFMVSPGLSDRLAEAAAGTALPYLPGVATASELLRAREKGFSHVKFFPAEFCRRHSRAEGAERRLPRHAFLPDRGADAGECAGLARPPIGCLRRRQLAGPGRASRRPGSDLRACEASGGASPLAEPLRFCIPVAYDTGFR